MRPRLNDVLWRFDWDFAGQFNTSVNAKDILISTAIACFDAHYSIPVVSPLGYKLFRFKPS